MRLAVFTSQFPGRINTFFARDMRSLLDAGIELELFPLYPLDERLWAAVPECLAENVLARTRVHHVTVHRSLAPGLLGTMLRTAVDAARISASALQFGAVPLAKSMYALMKSQVWADRHRGRFDHVLAYWGNYAATAAYVFHRLTHPQVPFSMFLHAGTDLYRDQVFLRQKLQYADNIVLVCEFNRAFLRSLYPDLVPDIEPKLRTHLLPLDLDEYAFQPAARLSRQVLAVGSLEAAKGFDVLVRAAAILVKNGVDVDVRIIGDGPQRASLAALATELGLGQRVTFSGWQSPGQVRLAMQQATLLAHSPTGLGDAVPTVIKEALALGTPVVATTVAGIPELLDEGRCGVLVDPRHPDLLARAIAQLLASPAQREHNARAGRDFAEKMFDIRRNGPRLAALLRSSVRTPRPAPGQSSTAAPSPVLHQ